MLSVVQFRRDLLSYPTNWLPVSRHVSHTVLVLPQDDGDAGNYVSTKPGSDMCAKGEFPCCQDPSKRGISSFGKGTYSLCKGCARGQTRQSNCPGTPYGLLSMGPPTGSRVVGKEKGVPSGDLGECSYRTDWGWVVRAMWVTPASAAGGQSSTFVWSDGSAVDYSAWFAGNLPARTNEDEVELRCDCPVALCLALSNCRACSGLATQDGVRLVGLLSRLVERQHQRLGTALPVREQGAQVQARRHRHELAGRAAVLPSEGLRRPGVHPLRARPGGRPRCLCAAHRREPMRRPLQGQGERAGRCCPLFTRPPVLTEIVPTSMSCLFNVAC